jgi:AraC family transcriptional regulator, regulatory protein of adaptative response / DNA-3-methyladenine glycosylase II
MLAADGSPLDHDALSRAVVARDPRFDGVFFVGISTTGIYCRPVCPARVSYPERRRFFASAAEAERDGFRPCMRCRPELAPGRAVCDAVPRVARAAAARIAAGALNGRSVMELARELGVTERHLRRAMERELGVTPVELAQTHRLLLAKCLLTDTDLPVTRIAFASGFQSLRRFNSVFRQRYRMSPSALRQRPISEKGDEPSAGPPGEWIRLALGFRPPLDWEALVADIAPDTPAGVGLVEGRRYGRTVAIEGCRGVVFLEAGDEQVRVELSDALLPALMPLLARLRHLLDLDAEPAAIDPHLAAGGLHDLVHRRPGLRVPGAFDAFEVVVRELLGPELLAVVTEELGDSIDTGVPLLERLAPTPERMADAGAELLTRLGVPSPAAGALVHVARALIEGALRLEPGGDVQATLRELGRIPGFDSDTATRIVIRALHWPDAFPMGDPRLQRAAGVTGTRAMSRLADQWRPWRSYGAAHLRWAPPIRDMRSSLGLVGERGMPPPRAASA